MSIDSRQGFTSFYVKKCSYPNVVPASFIVLVFMSGHFSIYPDNLQSWHLQIIKLLFAQKSAGVEFFFTESRDRSVTCDPVLCIRQAKGCASKSLYARKYLTISLLLTKVEMVYTECVHKISFCLGPEEEYNCRQKHKAKIWTWSRGIYQNVIW